MPRSRSFWLAALALALLPVLVLELTQHYLAWQKEVRQELILLVQNMYSFNREQKAVLLDRVFARNQELLWLSWAKSVGLLVLALAGGWGWARHRRQQPRGGRALLATLGLAAGLLLLRAVVLSRLLLPATVTLLPPDAATESLQRLHQRYFPGQVVYVDFWGTTCGPCLAEFQNFLQPLKARYHGRQELGYLYIAQGNAYLWREQLRHYALTGHHLFATQAQYQTLFRRALPDYHGPVMMPRYLILDKRGRLVVTDAQRPSGQNSLYAQLDKYLSQ